MIYKCNNVYNTFTGSLSYDEVPRTTVISRVY